MKFLISILFAAIVAQTYSDTNDSLYFPLAVGNKWVYNTMLQGGFPTVYGTFSMKISDTQIINGKRYYKCDYYWESFTTIWIRYNSQTGYLVKYDSLNEQCGREQNLYKFTALQGDTISDPCTYNRYVCNLIQDTTLFGITATLKSFYFSYFGPYAFSISDWKFLKNRGPYYQFHISGHNIPIASTQFLKGCVINGILYGDTSLIGIKTISSEIPKGFELSQNYPNPFNPKTKIGFKITANSFVILKIFDVIGNEVSTLVNAQTKPGSYEIDFEAGSLPSGVYFYTITAGDYSQTKKMLLVK